MRRSKDAWRCTPISAFLALLLLSSAVKCEDGSTAPKSEEGQVVPAAMGGSLVGRYEDEPLLISLLDGTVAAVDKHTGETLWTFDTESPLVSVGEAQEYAYSVFPGVDGALYTYKRGVTGGLQRLPITVAAFVEGTPSVTADGALVLGSRHTHAFLVDMKTGKLIKSYVEYGGPLGHNASLTELPKDAVPVSIGRVDYVIRSIDQHTGEELWNVTYSRLMRLNSVQQMLKDTDISQLQGSDDKLAALGITVGPQNILRRVDPETEEVLWSVTFDNPAVAVFLDADSVMSLYKPAALVQPSQDDSLVSTFLGTNDAASRRPESVLVGRLGESLYALPLGEDAGPERASMELLPVIQDSMKQLNPNHMGQCSLEEGSADEEEQSSVGPDQSESKQGISRWDLPLGVHSLNDTPSPLIPERLTEQSNVTNDLTAKQKLGVMGFSTGTAVLSGSAVFVTLFYALFRKPRIIASVRHPDEGVTVLTLSYTGTTDEAEEARRNGQAVLGETADTRKSSIRDNTGSGVEHLPEEEEGEESETGSQPFRRIGEIAGEVTKAGARLNEKVQDELQKTPFGRSSSSNDSGRKNSSQGALQSSEEGRKSSVSDKDRSQGGGDGLEDQLIRDRTSSGQQGERSDSQEAEDDEQRDRYSISEEEAGPSGRQHSAFERLSKLGERIQGAQDYSSSTSGSKDSMESNIRITERRDGITYVGRLEIGPGIVGYGSSGTLVFEGSLDGRKVAVKRILRQFYELARKEIGALIVSDEHPNIVRCFAMEEDAEFVYLALERCKESLNDMVTRPDARSLLLQEDGHPTQFCMQVIEEAGRGLLALHERGIVHRDLKPHNVLLTEGRRTKLSDMGLCKRLTVDQSSYESAGPGGSSGWQAPEQLISRNGGEVRQGRSVDTFSFGLLLYWCLTGGKHAFGEAYERDYRIIQGRADLNALSHLLEGMNLVRAMLRPQPKQRPTMAAVMAHPFWWPAARQLAFLIEVSNRVENEDREVDRSLLRALEMCGDEAFSGPQWADKLDEEFLANLGRYRKYNPHSLRDLLRVIRNKHNHFREMPEELQARLGPLPDTYLRYFTERFPCLLLTTYSFALTHCGHEPVLQQYFPEGAKEFPFLSAIMSVRLSQAQRKPSHSLPPMLKIDQDRTSSAPAEVSREPPLATVDELRDTQRSKSESALLPPPPPRREPRPTRGDGPQHRGWWSSSESEDGRSEGSSDVASARGSGEMPSTSLPSGLPRTSATEARRGASDPISGYGGNELQAFIDPRTYQQDHRSGDQSARAISLPMLQGRSWSPGRAMLGGKPPSPPKPARGTPPPPPPPNKGETLAEDSKVDGVVADGRVDGLARNMPELAGLSVGTAQGVPGVSDGMKYIRNDALVVPVFPQRPGAPQCDFHAKTGHCKFGNDCRFHHDLKYAVKLNSQGHPLRQGQLPCVFYTRTGDCKFGPACKFHHPEPSADRSSSGGSGSSVSSGSLGLM